MDAGSLQERQHLVEIARDLGLQGVTVEDFKHVVCMTSDGGTSAGPVFTEDFCPLLTTQQNQAVLFTYINAYFTNSALDGTNFTLHDIEEEILGRWLDNLNTASVGADGIFKSYTAQLPIRLMINRPILHVGLSDRMVGIGIAQATTSNRIRIEAVGYLVSQEIGTQFAKLETNFIGVIGAIGGTITSVNGTDAATGRQKSAPGL